MGRHGDRIDFSAPGVAWFRNGTGMPLRHNASGHDPEQHLSIGRLWGLLTRSMPCRLTTVDKSVLAWRANSADNSVPAAPRDSVPRKHQRR
jgi:hypothetical protein